MSIKNAAKGKIKTQIIVVDNASYDHSKEFIEEKFDDITYIYNEENLGFSKANNQGLKIATGKYILILNPDTILYDNVFEKFIEYFENNPKVTMATAKIITPEGKLDSVCHRSFPTAWNSFCHISGLSKLFPNSKKISSYNLLYLPENEISEVDSISGSFMFFRREVLDENILMPTDYFMYGEDIDFCYQIKKQGYKIIYLPLAKVIHYRGRSSRKEKIKTKKHFFKSMNIFIKKNYNNKYSFWYKIALNIAIFLGYIVSIIKITTQNLIMPLLDIISYALGLIIGIEAYKPIVKILKDSNYIPNPLTIAQYYVISLLYIAIIIGIFLYNRLYQENKFKYKKFFISTIIVFLLTSTITYFLKFFAFSRIVLFSTLCSSFALMYIWRIILLKRLKIFFGRALVLGIDDNSKKISELGKKITHYGMSIAGYVDKKENFKINKVTKYPIFGNITTLKDLIDLEKIDNLIISAKSFSLTEILALQKSLDEYNLNYYILPEEYEIINNKLKLLQIQK